MEAGWDIDCDDWLPGIVDEFDGFTIGSGHERGQSGAEEGIDEDVAGGEEWARLVGRPESNDRCFSGYSNEPAIHRRGIATQVGHRGEEDHVNSRASAVKQSGHNQSVSSVVPFSTEDGNGLASYWSTVFLQIPDNSFAGPLHQDGTGDMRFGDRAAIERLHLGSGHDLHWWPWARDRSRKRNRVSERRKEVCCLRCNVMTRANRVVHGEMQDAGTGAMVQPSNAFISLTAWSRPTRIARAMML